MSPEKPTSSEEYDQVFPVQLTKAPAETPGLETLAFLSAEYVEITGSGDSSCPDD